MRLRESISVFVLSVLLLCGCSGSEPAANMESRNPYWLTYDGSEREAQERLRRELSFAGWTILSAERGTVSAQKVLAPDEMASTKVVTGGMVGGGAGGHEGRITFSIETHEEDTWVSMKAVVATEGSPTNRGSTARPMMRKHPLMLKMGRQLDTLSGFELHAPPPSAVRRWMRASRQ